MATQQDKANSKVKARVRAKATSEARAVRRGANKPLIHLLITGLILVILSPGQLYSQNFSDFEWLLGTWESASNNEKVQSYEVWEKAEDGHLKGIGYTMKNGDTTFVEILSIIEKSGGYYYVADVDHNPAPVLFEIIFVNDSGFSASNPDHDFPKLIRYEMNDGVLDVEISGDGKSGTFQFKPAR